jgi:hypothetical protein
MNDNELSTAVRESVAGIHAATPVDEIISRGRAVRARRRIPLAAGTLATAGGTALAVAVLLSAHPGPVSSGHSPGHPAPVRLTAWTVARQANGDIYITIRQLKNPAGLQATLRADGLPATVSFSGPPLSASCRPYSPPRSVLGAVARLHRHALAIDPSALPSGTGVAIFDKPGAGRSKPGGPAPAHMVPPGHRPTGPTPATDGPLTVSLVYASQQCTG